MPELPEGAILDPDVSSHDAERGIWWVIYPDGTRAAWNGVTAVLCPNCEADPERMPDCHTCVGRGQVDSIPYADRPWDEVIPGLWLGGVHCQFGHPDAPEGNCFPEDRFEVVLSLYHDPGYDPAPGVIHHTYRIADADLDPEHHTHLDYLAERVLADVESGRWVLVRCQAGLNRSSLVVALVLLKKGWSVEAILDHLRTVRSPFALCNPSFVSYLREVEARG